MPHDHWVMTRRILQIEAAIMGYLMMVEVVWASGMDATGQTEGCVETLHGVGMPPELAKDLQPL